MHRITLVGLALLLVAGCARPPAPPSPVAAASLARGSIVVVSQEGRVATPAARCGAGCAEDPTATPDDFFPRFAASVSTQTALLAEQATMQPVRAAAVTPIGEAAARPLLAAPPPSASPTPGMSTAPPSGSQLGPLAAILGVPVSGGTPRATGTAARAATVTGTREPSATRTATSIPTPTTGAPARPAKPAAPSAR